MLMIGHQHQCFRYTAALVSAMAVPEIFIPEAQLNLSPVDPNGETYTNADRIEDTAREQRKKAYNAAHATLSSQDKQADVLKLLSAFCAYLWATQSNDIEAFCKSMFLRSKAMKEAHQLYQQLLNITAINRPGSIDPHRKALPPPSKTQIPVLKQIVAAAFLNNVAVRYDLAPQPPELTRKPKRNIEVPYLPLFPIHKGRSQSVEEVAVFIHPSSALAHTPLKDLPQYIIYSKLQRSTPSTVAGSTIPKTRMNPLTPVTGAQLAGLARGTPLLRYGKPVGKVQFVEGKLDERRAWVVPSMCGEKGGTEWPLPALKVLQKRDQRGEWVVIKVER